MQSTNTKHIVLLSSYLHVPGGYEKMVVNLANLFAQNGFLVTLLVLDEPGAVFYPLDPTVQLLQEQLLFGIGPTGNVATRKMALARDVYSLQKILRRLKPDIVIASEYVFAIAAALAGAGRFAGIYSWEHHHFGTQKRNAFWNGLFRLFYPRLRAAVVLNEDERRLFLRYNKRATVIPNFIEPPANVRAQSGKASLILTVSRWNHIKGVDLLMEVAKRVLAANPLIRWKLIGYGQYEPELKRFIAAENLETRLILSKATSPEITEEYTAASFFVLTSRNECFPMTLLEAQSFGLPCIAFDCETGPRHIITHNVNGLLIEKEATEQMAVAILKLWDDAEKRRRMSLAALQGIRQFYPARVLQKWTSLFES